LKELHVSLETVGTNNSNVKEPQDQKDKWWANHNPRVTCNCLRGCSHYYTNFHKTDTSF